MLSNNSCALNNSFDIDELEFDIIEKTSSELEQCNNEYKEQECKLFSFQTEIEYSDNDYFDIFSQEINKKNTTYFKDINVNELGIKKRILFA